MRKATLQALFVAILLWSAQSVSGSTSQAGAIFLTIFPGGRPNGMGTAFTALANDAMATYYNHAGLAFHEVTDVTLMHANWLTGLYPDMYYEFIGFTHPVGEWGGTIGGNFVYLTTGETHATDETGNEIARFRNFDFSFLLCYGTKLRESLGIGVGAKLIYSYLCPSWIVSRFFPGTKGGGAGSSWAVDLSLLYKAPLRGLQLGGSLQNFGPSLTFVEGGEHDPLPRTLRLGAAYKILDSRMNKLTTAVELTKVLVGMRASELKEEWKDTWKGYGLEYTWYDLISGRVGYFEDVAGVRIGPTFGAGIQLKDLRFDLGVDSELYDFPTDNYRFSLSYSF